MVREEEVLYALWTIEILVESGVGLESAIKHIAEGDYGRISNEFKTVLRGEEENLERALLKLANRTKVKGLKTALRSIVRALRSGGSLADSIRTFAQRETEERRIRLAKFVERLTTVSEIFITACILIPIIIIVVTFVDVLMKGAGGVVMISSELVRLSLGVNILILGFIILWVMLYEQKV